MAQANVINKKKGAGNIVSISFLIIVILSSVGLYFYNDYLVTENESITKSIRSIEDNILEVENDKNLQIYSLLELNKGVIAAYESMNYITKFINHMNILETKYNIKFSGFELSKGKITTNVQTISDEDGIAHQKTKDFINQYRTEPKAIFDLGFVNSVEGMDIMKFNVDFKIK